MDSMVERIARAIYDEMEGPVNNQDFARQTRQWALAQRLAAAALTELNNPTEAMISHAVDYTGPVGCCNISGTDAMEIWQAMLTAALSDTEGR
ncbi:hypothetical protein [Novosphingobium sp. Chol11]|uniref:hypothetical protein n=1 Tax=Novosphingobium sp. Chol11 TaxID=1385763 RepID=UPI001144198D|nr:hypothetical protein [Novosphingobium sp. Chol11]